MCACICVCILVHIAVVMWYILDRYIVIATIHRTIYNCSVYSNYLENTHTSGCSLSMYVSDTIIAKHCTTLANVTSAHITMICGLTESLHDWLSQRKWHRTVKVSIAELGVSGFPVRGTPSVPKHCG